MKQVINFINIQEKLYLNMSFHTYLIIFHFFIIYTNYIFVFQEKSWSASWTGARSKRINFENNATQHSNKNEVRNVFFILIILINFITVFVNYYKSNKLITIYIIRLIECWRIIKSNSYSYVKRARRFFQNFCY